jgi:hypothetical protein
MGAPSLRNVHLFLIIRPLYPLPVVSRQPSLDLSTLFFSVPFTLLLSSLSLLPCAAHCCSCYSVSTTCGCFSHLTHGERPVEHCPLFGRPHHWLPDLHRLRQLHPSAATYLTARLSKTTEKGLDTLEKGPVYIEYHHSHSRDLRNLDPSNF